MADKINKYIKKYKALNNAMQKAGITDSELVTITSLSALDAIQKTSTPDKCHSDLIKMLKALEIKEKGL